MGMDKVQPVHDLRAFKLEHLPGNGAVQNEIQSQQSQIYLDRHDQDARIRLFTDFRQIY